MPYNVRFVCIPSVEGVKCTLDGVVKYSVNGFADFYNKSAGAHSYSVVAPSGWKFVSGEDAFKRPLGESGTTVIEVPGGGVWPTEIPWLLKFNFEEIIVAGHIFDILYWYAGMSQWKEMWPIDQYVPPPTGLSISFNPRWKNDSSLTVTGHMDIEVTSPSGVKYYPSASSGQDATVAPGGNGYPRFNPVLLNESGTWTLKHTLTCDGVFCDERTINFTVEAVGLGEFRFDSWNPGAFDYREIFVVGAVWPALVRPVDVGEDVYLYYVVKNVGTEAGESKITVKDLDTGAVITTWSIPELAPNERFKTTSPGAYLGKMPGNDWSLEFKVEP